MCCSQKITIWCRDPFPKWPSPNFWWTTQKAHCLRRAGFFPVTNTKSSAKRGTFAWLNWILQLFCRSLWTKQRQDSTNFKKWCNYNVLKQDVVVLYHSPLCGMCGSASLVFLTVANLFRNTANIRFVRVDGENNDLPWQYAMESYPTILFFPANRFYIRIYKFEIDRWQQLLHLYRKAESRVFPKSQPITLEMITHFVLANLRPESRLQSLLNLHGSKNIARLHTLLAIRGISYFKPTKKLTGMQHIWTPKICISFFHLQVLHCCSGAVWSKGRSICDCFTWLCSRVI